MSGCSTAEASLPVTECSAGELLEEKEDEEKPNFEDLLCNNWATMSSSHVRTGAKITEMENKRMLVEHYGGMSDSSEVLR